MTVWVETSGQTRDPEGSSLPAGLVKPWDPSEEQVEVAGEGQGVWPPPAGAATPSPPPRPTDPVEQPEDQQTDGAKPGRNLPYFSDYKAT